MGRVKEKGANERIEIFCNQTLMHIPEADKRRK